MSDVTALVLSIGESYTERAIASVQHQTLPAAETIVVQGLSPFHHAFNSGVVRVRTEFFLQVDADIILDETCIEDLRRCMADGVGMVVGHLRDPLLGRIQGIKLFRTWCCGQVRLRNSASFETDFIADIEREGWTTIYALKETGGASTGWHVFGEHCPDYIPAYTFCKYVREGVKARYRKAGSGLRSVFRRLHASSHSAATIAAIAAAHGIFMEAERDIQEPGTYSEEFERLERFLRTPMITGVAVADDGVQRHLNQGFRRVSNFIWLHLVGSHHLLLASRFKRAYALGIQLRRQQAAAAFMTHMRQLQQANDLASWVALVGLCHGLFATEYNETEAEKAFTILKELLPG